MADAEPGYGIDIVYDGDVPPAYQPDADPFAHPPTEEEGKAAAHDNDASPAMQQHPKPQLARQIYIAQMPNEPPPMVTIITPDLIEQYVGEHIVYPKGDSNSTPPISRTQAIQPNVVQHATVHPVLGEQDAAPPAYDEAHDDTLPIGDEGNPAVHSNDTQPAAQPQPQRARQMYIVQMPNEPQPVITIITLDLIEQYVGEHIVYPKGDRNNSQPISRALIIQPQVVHKAPVRSDDNDVDGPVELRTKPDPATSTVETFDPPPASMEADSNEYIVTERFNLDKRTPSEKPSKYNLMHGRINLLVFLYLWALLIVAASLDNSTSIDFGKYCYDAYSSSCYDSDAQAACDADPWCQHERYVYPHEEQYCYMAGQDCQCCGDEQLSSAHKIYTAFYFFVGLNTFRLLLLDSYVAMRNLRGLDSYYALNEDTQKVKLQEYMDYLCDHPLSYVVGLLYPEANQAMTEATIYNIAMPNAGFLFLNLGLLYFPFIVLVSCMINEQILLMDIWTTTTPTPSGSSAHDIGSALLITYMVGLALLLIGFAMTIHRWRRKNITERENVEKAAAKQGKQIVIKLQRFPNDWMCGLRNAPVRTASDRPRCINLWFRWIHFFILLYLWFVFGYTVQSIYDGKMTVGGGGFPGHENQSLFTSFFAFLVFNTGRIMVITLPPGIGHVNNQYNYIVDKKTGKVMQRPFMDYLCDHPAGIVVGLLYPDANKAITEATKYNLAFADNLFVGFNMFVFYIPVMVISAVWSERLNDDLSVVFMLASILCVLGILCHVYRFKMKKDWETAISS